MPRRITIQAHLSVPELESRYRHSKDPVERTHYQIIWLLAKGLPTEQVAEVTGYSRDWIRQVARRYNKEGSAGLGDRRHENPGAEPLLSPQQETELWEALQGPPPNGGLWNSRTVADWISDRIARPVAVQRGWDYLQQIKAKLATEGTLNGSDRLMEVVTLPNPTPTPKLSNSE